MQMPPLEPGDGHSAAALPVLSEPRPDLAPVDSQAPSAEGGGFDAHGDLAVDGGSIGHAERAFAAFVAHHGTRLCGTALGPAFLDQGRPTQVYANLILRLESDGRVSLRPLGAEQLARPERPPAAGAAARPALLDLRGRLPAHGQLRYSRRPLAALRHLVIHHSGADVRLDAAAIASEHVRANGWPGIGYHFVVDADGVIAWCQDLGLVTHHVAQFNPVSLGIALLGDFRVGRPSTAQLGASAQLLAWLCADLGLPPSSIRGHGEFVPTDCPGPDFQKVWKAELVAQVAERLRLAIGPTDVEAAEAETVSREG